MLQQAAVLLQAYWRIAIWLLACLTASFACRRRPVVLAGIVLTLWVIVPGVATQVLTGPLAGSIAYAAPTLFLLCAIFVQVLANPTDLLEEIGRRFSLYVTIALVVSAAILVTRTSTDKGGIVLIIDQILAPALLFLMVGAGVGGGHGSLTLLRNWLIVLAALEAGLALLQYGAKSVIFYQSYYRSFYWFNPATNTRWFGTTDSPLALSLLIATAVPLMAGLRTSWLKVVLVVVLGAGLLVTQSRTGLLFFAVGAVYLVQASSLRSGGKLVILGLMSFGAVLAAGTSLASGVLGRLVDDTGSTLARSTARDVFISNWKSYLFGGDGITAGFHLTKSAGLSTSLESSVLMYAAGIGITFTVLYFGVQTIIVFKSMTASTLAGAPLAAVVVLIVPQTYSALATESLAGPLLWLIMALAVGRTGGGAAGRSPVNALALTAPWLANRGPESDSLGDDRSGASSAKRPQLQPVFDSSPR